MKKEKKNERFVVNLFLAFAITMVILDFVLKKEIIRVESLTEVFTWSVAGIALYAILFATLEVLGRMKKTEKTK